MPDRPVALPMDERPHLDRLIEWWYFVGHLKPVGQDDHPGYTIGFIVLRAGFVLHGVVGLVLWVDHAKGVRPACESNRLLSTAYTSQGASGYRFEFPTGGLGGQTWTLEASDDLHYSLRLSENGVFSIDLDLAPGPAYLLGDRGVVDYGQDVQLAYYVRPHLPTKGRIRPGGGPAIDVAGHMWLERQWGDENPTAVRWKYLLVHASDREQWIFFHLAHLRGARGEKRFGCRMRDGVLEHLPERDIEIVDVPRAGGPPVASEVRVPSRGIDLVIEPLFGQRQHYRPRLAPAFFEGASRVQGKIAGEPIDCWGMTELANY